MVATVPVELPAGFNLTEHGRGRYVLTRNGRTLGYITAVEGLYVVSAGSHPPSARHVGRFPGFRQALLALAKAARP